MRALVVTTIVIAGSPLAHAEELDASLQIASTSPTPRVEVTIAGHPPPVGELWLDVPGELPIRATQILPDREPIAMAFVYCGQMTWIGTSSYQHDDDGFAGMLSVLEDSIDAVHFADRWPRGSKAIAISYGTGARVQYPMQSMERFAGSSLGHESDYRDNIGTDLAAGLERGLAALEAEPIKRRLLVVIGDGNDTNGEAAKPRLREVAARARRSNIEIAAIVSRSEVSLDGNVISGLTRRWSLAESADSLRTELERVVAAHQRYNAEFPAIRFDGTERDLELHAGLDSAELRLGFEPHCRFGGRPVTPRWIVIVCLAIGLIPLSAAGRSITLATTSR